MLGGSIDGIFNDFLGGVQEGRLQVFIPLLGKTCSATLDSVDGVGDSSYRICLMSQIINSFEVGQETMAMEILIMVIIDGKFTGILVIHGGLGIGKLAQLAMHAFQFICMLCRGIFINTTSDSNPTFGLCQQLCMAQPMGGQ